MKTCVKCGKPKYRSEFYRHPDTSDGLRSACKDCLSLQGKTYLRSEHGRAIKRAYGKKWNRENAEYKKALLRRWMKTPKGIAIAQARSRKDTDEGKCKARAALHYHVKMGHVRKLPCEVCGENAHAHHDDYSKPLEVRWLCPKHHSEHHRRQA